MTRTNLISICCAVFGVVLVAFGLILGYVIFPLVVDKLIKEELDLWNPDSEGRHNFVRRLDILKFRPNRQAELAHAVFCSWRATVQISPREKSF
jgi:hypothetical protein